ncbi:hypothetical protein P691DRAFT_774825 [Macrolepiota fuliginosa MF-IS2]|uniref:Uncharacterized protein n=1 Tax=Macrolepiota fuliginosa MF-IS2 TaxID=1400762 RepID=A0A9P6C5C1_9AGAR|nr:hypothetical protein P691DRAFT_774825 [Macrolepiota fuliginosa MF-IS2]
MPSELRRIKVHTGYKFYHDEYDMHSSHILQLLSELYFELEIFRDLWSDKGSTKIFVQDILTNMGSIQDTLGKPEDAGRGGVERSELRASGSNNRDSRPSPAHLENQRHPSPAPLKLQLREDRSKVLTIKLPPTKRSESVEGVTKDSCSRPVAPPAATTSAHPAATLPRTPRQKRSSKQGPAPKLWRPQPFHREYTTRGRITANTARHEHSPQHSPVIPSLHPSASQPGPSRQPVRRTRNNLGKPPQKRPQLPPIKTDIGTGAPRIEVQACSANSSGLDGSPIGKGKGKRRREDVEEVNAENLEARKRTRRK